MVASQSSCTTCRQRLWVLNCASCSIHPASKLAIIHYKDLIVTRRNQGKRNQSILFPKETKIYDRPKHKYRCGNLFRALSRSSKRVAAERKRSVKFNAMKCLSSGLWSICTKITDSPTRQVIVTEKKKIGIQCPVLHQCFIFLKKPSKIIATCI
jgi:hypothetical protein